MLPAVSARAKKTAGAALGVVVVVVGLTAWSGREPQAQPHELLTIERPSARDQSATSEPSQPMGSAAALPADVIEMLENGPKAPLSPPEIRIDVELARGAVATAEPLTPPVIDLGEIEAGRGARPSAEVLVPPAIELENAAVARGR
jgi:hypothetical protein